MLEKFYYESSDGSQRIDFGDQIYVEESDIRGYEWDYTDIGFVRNAGEKNLPLRFIGKNQLDVENLRNMAFRIFERDVKLNKPGRIWVNDYFLECFFAKVQNSDYVYDRHIVSDYKLLIPTGMWTKEKTYRFDQIKVDQNGVDYPHDYPHDLGLSSDDKSRVIKNDCIVSSEFIITVYGPCENPWIEIAGHKYGLRGSIGDNERVVIVGKKGKQRAITKIAADESRLDWFSHRDFASSIFDPIPEGNIMVAWDGSFGFDLTLVDSRSEPVWDFEKKEEPAPYVDYLMDSDMNQILDSIGDRLIMIGV